MKNFLLRTRKNSPHSSLKRAVGKLFLIIAGALILIWILRGFLGTALSHITYPFEAIANYFVTSTATLPTYIRDRNDLNEEIARLKAELAGVSGSQSTIARLGQENTELRLLLGDGGEERIAAAVIARPPLVPYDLLVLDRGNMHGVRVGAPVYYAEKHVVGLVSRVFEESSLVTLISTAGAETTVYLYGPNVFAYAYGEGGGVTRISVPQGVELKEGDPVVLASLHTGDIGVIEKVVSIPAEPEQNAYVTFPVPIHSLRIVSVGKSVVEPKIFENIAPDIMLIKDRFKMTVPDIERSTTSTTSATSTLTATST